MSDNKIKHKRENAHIHNIKLSYAIYNKYIPYWINIFAGLNKTFLPTNCIAVSINILF